MGLFRGAFTLFLFFAASSGIFASEVVDGLGRKVTIPDEVERTICSGSGCLRLATYLGLEDRIVAVDSIERKTDKFDARPYALARPNFKDLPLFGEFRGNDNAELILSLDPAPQVIFKAGCTVEEAEKLQAKTGIPVVAFDFGNLGDGRRKLYFALRLMAETTGVSERAEAIVTFFEESIEDLRSRTDGVGEISSYVGGIAFKGPHGLLSTEPAYPPFLFLGVRNVAAEGAGAEAKHAVVSKEALLRWDPEILFIDLSTTTAPGGGALSELTEDPLWKGLSSVKAGKVYGVLPYNWYSQNFGNILADAYFIGSVLFPERFSDVDPAAKADEIYRFLVGEPVFSRLNAAFGGRVFLKAMPEAAGADASR